MKLDTLYLEKCSGIYLINNKINNHKYVGQAKNIKLRIYEHLRSSFNPSRSDYGYPVHAAIRKYGIDNFDLQILEYCAVPQLNSREQYWIKYFNCKENGYNQTEGGYQSIRFIKLTEQDVYMIKHLLAENKLTNKELAQQFNVSQSVIQRINTGRMWFDSDMGYPIRKKPIDRTYHYNGTCIEQYDLNNNLIARFISMSEAAKSLEKGNSNSVAGPISRCCSGLRKSAYGYKWKQVPISEEEWLKLINKNNIVKGL